MQITYSPADSALYRLNPFIKGLGTLFIILLFSVTMQGLFSLFFSLVLTILLAILFKVELKPILISIEKIWLLLLLVGIIQGFSTGNFNPESLLIAVIRIIGVFVTSGIFVTISSQSELMYFWEQSFRPLNLFGFQARELALVMVISVRFLPVILGELDRIRMAQMARGARFSHGVGLKAVKSLMPLLIPTLSLAIIRAEDLALAMEARGYCVSRQRTRYNHFSIGFFDIFVCGIMLGTILAYVLQIRF